MRVEIESIAHKALRRFAETGSAKELPGNWRMTFRIGDPLAIEDKDLEDYH